MLSLEEAIERVCAGVQPLPPEICGLTEALGRTPAVAVVSTIDLPPFDNSAMDGYAVRSADLAAATESQPVTLRLIGKAPAGTVFSGAVGPGTCVRIFTGSPLPEGADAVVMQEDVKIAPAEPEKIVFSEKAPPFENVRLRGEDIKKGAELVSPAIKKLVPQRLGLLAAAGIPSISVRARPVVGLLATGDELREPGEPLFPGLIYESNRTTLSLLAQCVGASPKIYPIVPDDLAATKAALEKAFAECHIVVTTGGVSVGEMDFVKAAFESLGCPLDFWKVDMRPGRPFAYGRWNGKPFFGLPGNPVSAFVTFFLLACPVIRAMSSPVFSQRAPPSVMATLSESLTNDGDRRHFVRVMIDQHKRAKPAGAQASHMLSSLADAVGLVDVPPKTTILPGTQVQVLYWL